MVRVRATDIEDRSLPAVCVVTGRPATWNWNVRYVNQAGALVLLLVFGVLPYVVARYLTRHEVSGQLPISEEGITRVRERRRLRVLGASGALALALGGVALGALLDSWEVAAAVLAVALVAWIASAMVWVAPVGGEVESNGRWVQLTGAHPAFAAAVEPLSRPAPLQAR